MKKILLVFGSGGHSAQGINLSKKLGEDFEIEFLLETEDPFSKKRINNNNYYEVPAIRGKKEHPVATAVRVTVCSVKSLVIFFKAKPDIILSTGPGIAIPISYIAKLFGKKIIFIESWSRVTTQSIAGKLIYPIANRFYVQWPEMKKNYPKAVHKGRLG